jgi:Tfp pilus assembly protein PilX
VNDSSVEREFKQLTLEKARAELREAELKVQRAAVDLEQSMQIRDFTERCIRNGTLPSLPTGPLTFKPERRSG